MDASDDRDIKLQRASAELLSDLEIGLGQSLRKNGSVRRVVKRASLEKLVNLLEPFQEMPQLLDPKLSAFVPTLVDAFVDFLIIRKGRYPTAEKLSQDAVPLPRAVCRLLYVFCKIRGEKVICRFFDHRPALLEPMLTAFEAWGKNPSFNGEDDSHSIALLTWEEKYIMLLWLSQLLLAPFDLASISSTDLAAFDTERVGNVHLKLPESVPSIAIRVLILALEHLPSPGKERESAKTLLVRLTVRPDMNSLGLSKCVITWAMDALMACGSAEGNNASVYQAVGILSFLAGVLAAGEKGIISPFILPIYRSAFVLATDEKLYGNLMESALGKKMIIKLLRTIVRLTLRPDNCAAGGISEDTASSILEDTIDYLLTSLAAADTPTRFAASKALSQITLQLDPDLAAEVVEAILGSLNEDVLTIETTSSSISTTESIFDHQRNLRKSLAAVNAGRWHGLVLSLSQLLLRRSPPQSQLPEILKALLKALSFEQRSSTGGSIGANVRDAACFGIWSVVRGYSTQQLLAIDVHSVHGSSNEHPEFNTLQHLAVELVVSACLDSSGNIRRGSSAALQELIGRHPDTIVNGIPLVQAVDYHAIALRSRALTEVALEASKLGRVYWEALFTAMLDWRGVGSPDELSRRTAAKAIGLLSEITDDTSARQMLADINSVLGALRSTEVEERHGLLLGLASWLESTTAREEIRHHTNAVEETPLVGKDAPTKVLQHVSALPDNDFIAFSRRPELTAEAACVLVSSLLRRCQRLQIGFQNEDIASCLRIISLSMTRSEELVISATSTAAMSLFGILDLERKLSLTRQWIDLLINGKKSVVLPGGHLASLGAVFSSVANEEEEEALSIVQNEIVNAILFYCGEKVAVEFRVAGLQSLRNGVIRSNSVTDSIVDTLHGCLRDYSVDQRGDVGSWIRLEAVDAVCEGWKHGLFSEVAQRLLLPELCRLAAEKLDKVRHRAWLCLRGVAALPLCTNALSILDCSPSDLAFVSSESYFSQLLQLLISNAHWLRIPLLEGLVTSAGGGHESLLRASRASLTKFVYELPVEDSDYNLVEFCKDINQMLKLNLLNDRILVPCLEVVSYLFDTRALQRASEARGDTGWRALLSLVQKSHYKSTNMQKLTASVQVYAGLSEIPTIQKESLSKLLSLLLHPFPRVRNMAAEIIFTAVLPNSQGIDCSSELRSTNWSAPPKELRQKVEKLKTAFSEHKKDI